MNRFRYSQASKDMLFFPRCSYYTYCGWFCISTPRAEGLQGGLDTELICLSVGKMSRFGILSPPSPILRVRLWLWSGHGTVLVYCCGMVRAWLWLVMIRVRVWVHFFCYGYGYECGMALPVPMPTV